MALYSFIVVGIQREKFVAESTRQIMCLSLFSEIKCLGWQRRELNNLIFSPERRNDWQTPDYFLVRTLRHKVSPFRTLFHLTSHSLYGHVHISP